MTIETNKIPFNFAPDDASFELKDVKLCVPVVTLSKNNEVKFKKRIFQRNNMEQIFVKSINTK